MRFMFKHRKLTPNSQVRILLQEEELLCLVNHLDLTYGLIDETKTEEWAIALKVLIGNLLAAYRELDFDLSELMNIPDFTEPDEIPDTIEVFPPMSYIWDHKETQRMITTAGENVALGLSFVFSAISRLVELQESLLSGGRPLRESATGWAWLLFDDAFERSLKTPPKEMEELKQLISEIHEDITVGTHGNPEPLLPIGSIVEGLRKELID
jgi:hypothetical protein